MLDLDDDTVFEAALLASLGAGVAVPVASNEPGGELRTHFADLLSTEITADLFQGQTATCAAAPMIPAQRVAKDSVPA